MPATYVRWERRDDADRNEMGLAALQLCRRWRAHGADVAKFYWANPSTIIMFHEGSPEALNVGNFNQDGDNAAAMFAMDDLARLVEAQPLVDGRGGQEAFQRAGSPTGT